jgi:hypothetical protein
LRVFQCIGSGMCVAFTPGSRYVVMGTKDGHVQVQPMTIVIVIILDTAVNCLAI